MRVLLEAFFLLLSFLDLEYTKRQIAEYGIEVELNGVIRKLAAKLGVSWGVFVGIMGPTFILAGLGWFLPQSLWFFSGMRTTLFLWQLQNAKR